MDKVVKMKVVELRKEKINSNYPIQEIDELHIYAEYFVVDKKTKDVYMLRYINDVSDWFLISVDSFYTSRLNLSIKELCDRFFVFCIPEYVGGSEGITKDIEETKKARLELFKFLIQEYLEEK